MLIFWIYTSNLWNYDETILHSSLKILEKMFRSDRQVYCKTHSLDKWFQKYLYYKIICTLSMIIFQECPAEK